MSIIGKCSEFGGAYDETMAADSGLAFYEPWEANRRPDIFLPEDPQWLESHCIWAAKYPGRPQPTWARLNPNFFYLAMRVYASMPRVVLQNTPFKIKSMETSSWCCAFVVDRGPGVETRIADLSPGVMKFLDLETDDEIEISQLPTA